MEAEGGFRAEVEDEVEDAEAGDKAEAVGPYLPIWGYGGEVGKVFAAYCRG